jgi:hypothetical protein
MRGACDGGRQRRGNRPPAGGRKVLGAEVRPQADLVRFGRGRLPLAALAGLTRAGMSEREIGTCVISQRTRRHRAAKRQPLTVVASERAVRLMLLWRRSGVQHAAALDGGYGMPADPASPRWNARWRSMRSPR